MEERILRFISALRAGGVRVSLAESADAFRAVDELGIEDREMFRLSLRTTLVKEAEHLPVFEELFPLFFGSGEHAPDDEHLRRSDAGGSQDAGGGAAAVQRAAAQDDGKAAARASSSTSRSWSSWPSWWG